MFAIFFLSLSLLPRFFLLTGCCRCLNYPYGMMLLLLFISGSLHVCTFFFFLLSIPEYFSFLFFIVVMALIKFHEGKNEDLRYSFILYIFFFSSSFKKKKKQFTRFISYISLHYFSFILTS